MRFSILIFSITSSAKLYVNASSMMTYHGSKIFLTRHGLMRSHFLANYLLNTVNELSFELLAHIVLCEDRNEIMIILLAYFSIYLFIFSRCCWKFDSSK